MTQNITYTTHALQTTLKTRFEISLRMDKFSEVNSNFVNLKSRLPMTDWTDTITTINGL